MIEITMPIYWHISHKKPKEPLGLNWYRNCHFRILNKVKQEYTAEVIKQLDGERVEGEYEVNVFLYLNSTAQDIDNFSCIATKFILDALVKSGAVQGDSNKHLLEIHSMFVCIKKENPHITLTINPL